MKVKIGITGMVICLASVAFGQGSLTPPGAPGATMKTLQQVEPRIDLATVASDSGVQHRINGAGSYYLSDNLVVSNSIGIAISSSDVTLDLNGFQILHAGGQSGKAIYVSASRNVTIKNGSIQEFEDGVYMYGSDGLYPPQGARLENLNISRCTGYGLFVGSMSKVINCHFTEVRGAAALFAAANSSIQNCTTDNSSGGHGFQLLTGARVSNCSAIDSGGTGFTAGSNSIFQVCTATLNAGDGFNLLAGSSVSGCTASDNGGGGFEMGSNCQIADSTATGSADVGVLMGHRSAARDCISLSSGGDGFHLLNASSVKGCTSSQNGADGFDLGIDCQISDCVASTNFTTGIIASEATISGCVASRNGGGGIDADDSSLANCTANQNTGSGLSGDSVLNCTANQNTGTGIYGLSVSACSAYNNESTGISGAVIVDCRSRYNDGTGISSYGGVVKNCSAENNSIGIFMDNGGLIENCVSTWNNGSGIVMTAECRVINNSSRNNKSWGIETDHTFGWIGENVVDGNTVTGNSKGIMLTDIGSGTPNDLLIRNVSHSNDSQNYEVFTNNKPAPIQTSLTGAGPWDNFSF